VWPTINTLLQGKTVIIYNADFDMSKLYSSAAAHGIELPYNVINTECAMHLFARFYGQMHEYYLTYTWQKLTTAISELEIEVAGQAHDAVHDAAATALLIKKLAELADQELPVGWHPPVNVPCAGCGHGGKECAEANVIWYCQSCSLEQGLFYRCPGCNHIVEAPASGFICDDLCEYCHEALHQEEMLLIGAWHWCPTSPYTIVETPDLEELCEHCIRQREWKRQQEEERRQYIERVERERKEHRQAYAKAYRQRRKEREQENRRRAALGLPPLEEPAKPIETIIHHHGHQFERRKDQYGRPEVFCLTCEAVWSKPPRSFCAGIKTYRSWLSIPEHLKTRTQLLKMKLQPAQSQNPEAIMDGSFDSYHLYNKNICVPLQRKSRTKKKASRS